MKLIKEVIVFLGAFVIAVGIILILVAFAAVFAMFLPTIVNIFGRFVGVL